jgi:hypothetical protein
MLAGSHISHLNESSRRMSGHDLLTAHGLGDLGPALREFVIRQRWFGGRGKAIAGTDVVDVGLLRDGNPTCLFLTLRVRN